MRDVIIALDFPSREKTLSFLKRFSGVKPFVKIGMELFYGEGPDIVREIKGMGHPVFLDLKLCDIPNTVARAMANLARLGVDMTNVHATGSTAMMEAAREGLNAGGGQGVKLIAVTVLTSIGADTLQGELAIGLPVEEAVVRYAGNAKAAGLDGVVCSPLEAKLVKENLGKDFLTVTPGIRYADGGAQDQARVATPENARAIGTDYIVVGRPITGAENPDEAYKRICLDFTGEEA